MAPCRKLCFFLVIVYYQILRPNYFDTNDQKNSKKLPKYTQFFGIKMTLGAIFLGAHNGRKNENMYIITF